jgi:hypothetical protein
MSDKEDELESCINKDQEYKKDEDVQYDDAFNHLEDDITKMQAPDEWPEPPEKKESSNELQT